MASNIVIHSPVASSSVSPTVLIFSLIARGQSTKCLASFSQQQPVPQGGSPTNGGASSNGQPIPSPAHVGNSWNSNVGTTPFSTPADTTAAPEWRPASPEALEAKFRLNQPTINAINKLLYEEGKQPQAPNSARESRSLLESAASHIGGGFGADGQTQGTSSSPGSSLGTGQGTGKPVNAKESRKALLDWAASHGLLITKWPSRWIRNGPEDNGGKEHHSFLVNEAGRLRWVKATKGNGSNFGFRPQDNGRDWSLAPKATAQEYIERLIHANGWGDDVHLHGVYHNPQTGEVSIITSQEHAAEDTPLTEEDLANAMSKAGFHTAGNNATFYRPSDNTAIFDAHLGNVVRQGYHIIPFDVLINHPPPNIARHLKRFTK